ncbi:L,D-transpeptidase [Actinoplanes sp. TBRC 11911]|nr:L,D-transpeptidase [Actinoplanes sp. TBRC 11911]
MLALVAGGVFLRPGAAADVRRPAPRATPPPTAVVVPVAAPAPRHLPKIDYFGVPAGFPADPRPGSTTAVTEGLHPARHLPVYDAPGGRPRAFLPRTISELPVVAPIVARRPGWVAVLLPSANRRIGWLPAGGWTPIALRDHVEVSLREHRLTWLRDGRRQRAWTVAVGGKRTPTPYGRTFVLGRTGTHGAVYGGLDAIVLAAVPEHRGNLAPGLRDGHTGIHGWARTWAFGRSVSNGCVRIPPEAQRILLRHLGPGTTVHVR